jgi:hypothetical protein
MSTETDTPTLVQQRWIAFGASGAAGTILHTRIGYAVRMLNDDTARGIYPTLEVAKSALHAAMAPGSSWPEFREH